MDVKGNITNLELFDVLKFLDISKKTGVLNLRFDDFAAKLFIKDGLLNFLSISENSILEKFIMKFLDISKEDYFQMIEKYRTYYKTTAGFDIYFFKLGVIPKDKENDFISNYILETINYILFLSNGEFSFDEKSLPEVINFASPINLIPVLLETKKRRDELAVMSKIIPSKQYVPHVITNRTENARPLSLSPAIWNVLSLIDGKRTVSQIIALSIENDFFIIKTLYNLSQSGYIHLDPPQNLKAANVDIVDSIKKILNEQLGKKAEKIPVDFSHVKTDKQSLTKLVNEIERYVYMFIDDKKAAKIDYLLKQLLMV
ncbi:MAG: DUF4388 domain-containing protein [Candidatus Acididesulfobacter diazotrophicus]|jgi:hypothetical protein|uniref:DUF4388 domain-containing protein n=1 Tax=Candidatus Acididesulfobacter diazotrophicus TaxID=2597226 RepID=A0A519BNR1_9DELT|nr:MAG: DUF4388 domain-containing protein [Candidatus Acididesulfobacter diazotrophicus]